MPPAPHRTPDDPAGARPERVVGRVVKAHGLRGELVVEPRTDNVAERFAPGVVLDVRARARAPEHPPTVTVAAARGHADRLLVTVQEVADRDGADALRSALLTAPVLEAAPDDPDEFHDHQLEGLAAVLTDGTVLGSVVDVLHGGGGGELLVVARDGGGELLVPFVAAIVPEVDVAGGRVVLDPPEGLLDP